MIRDEWPVRVRTESPLAASQIFRVWSEEAESTRRPSGDQAQPLTKDEWPVRGRRESPLAASQTFRVWSYAAESTRRPSGDQAQPLTEDEWPICSRRPLVPSRQCASVFSPLSHRSQ